MTSVAVIGDGQMGLVLADALHSRGVDVRIWGPFPEDASNLAKTRTSPRLPNFNLPDKITVTHDSEELFNGAEVAINAIPTQFIRGVWTSLMNCVPSGIPIACVAKGIETESLLLPTQVLCDVVGEASPTCVLSGPSIATELVKHLPAVMVASSSNAVMAEFVQDLFDVSWLRIYTHDDPVGVELSGATKNVIALAAGICDGMELGDNAKSAMLARGLAEISRLGIELGARLETFFGIAGVGDLATTCFSPHGRNRTCGERLGRGEDLAVIEKTMGSVVEGIATTKAVHQLASHHNVNMPISETMYNILFGGLQIEEAIALLMSRDLKAEQLS
ncbi:MAG: NAD(P)H-dependent glycerol-3-phosphate dehydrogenase [Planctomycetota bacterium]|nr:NAD(P)H-dependent glycerol-3-phosphate dehydrogenase [Planctomycetota bacterium]